MPEVLGTFQSIPLVLGTSLLPVFSMACRMASASALNADSDLCIVSHEERFEVMTN